MSRESYAALLAGFGQSLGLPGVAPDEEGYCALSFDELIVHFQYDDEADEVTAFAKLGEVDEDRAEGIYAMLLAANLFWQGTKGGTLAVEPDTGTAFIADRRPAVLLDEARFQDWLGQFVEIADHWRARLAKANAGGPLFDSDGDGDGGSGGPDGGGGGGGGQRPDDYIIRA